MKVYKELKDFTFQELVDFWYGELIMSLASANLPKSVMFRALDTAIRWAEEKEKDNQIKKVFRSR